MIDINRICQQYLADQQDGFVSNLQTYVYATYPGLSKKEADRIIFKLKSMTHDNISKHPTIR